MKHPRTAQEFIHWLEMGRGALWIRLAAVLAGALALSLLVAWKQFRGPTSEATLIQADTGRQLARGEGFSTLVNFPQTVAVLRARGVRFDPQQPYPELHQAPLYSLVIAGALRLVPAARREALFASAPVPPDGFAADYFLLGLNLALLWLAAWLTFDLARRLFEPRVGWLAALALLLSVSVWQQTVTVNGTPLLMVLMLGAFLLWQRLESAVEAGGAERPPLAWLGLLGAACGLLFLAEYSAGALVLVAFGYAAVRFRGPALWLSLILIGTGFAVVSGPWLARNVAVAGHPVGLAAHNVALKFGDPTAEPAIVRATLSAAAPRLDLKKLGNKTLTSLQENLKARFWSGGAMWLAAFFAAGWLYPFRSPTANRLRWVFTVALAVLLVAQAALGSGESERLATVWLAPLIMVFGAGFFFVLLGSNAALSQWPRSVTAALLLVQALPLAHDALEPRRLHFQYPPYFPALLQGMRMELERRGQTGRFGLMADVPAGIAWYGRARAWAQPPRLRDFYAITLEQPIGELLLTPRTLDRPFFSELNARLILPGSLAALPNRFGEWGEIYAGLLTGAMPREFPLGAPQKLAENLFVLLNPALPPARGK
ncbi:MAG: glycosyltransferase family 39 protein [Verrucomicrobia bacterium]|nr:glycosyltransferase family 39 protein [Verrucomicrobiota bacterium]